jgi:hypothetical protein
MDMCSIPNGFRDRAIPLYSSKLLDKKKILRTVSNNVIYCSSDKVGTVLYFSILLHDILNSTITDTMEIITTGRKGKRLNTLEKYHIYEISKKKCTHERY